MSGRSYWNIALFVPFGVLLPLCRSCRGRRCSFWRCLLLTLALSVGIEVVQPLLHACFAVQISRT
ncbi:MAG: VanZ family protein [Oscillospiraceae bacterium]